MDLVWFGNSEILHISLRVTVWVLGQSYDCPGAGEAALKNRVNKSYESNDDITQISMVSCQKGPTRHAYAWQIGPFWQDTPDICMFIWYTVLLVIYISTPPLVGTPREEEYAPAVTTLVQELCLKMRSIVQIYDEMRFYILDRLTKFENSLKSPVLAL